MSLKNTLEITDPSKLKVSSQEEFVNPTDVSWEAPSQDGGMSFLERIGTSIRGAWVNTVEHSALEKLIVETGVLETGYDESPMVEPKEAKDAFGLDIDSPIPREKAYILKKMKEEKEELNARLGEALFTGNVIELTAAWGAMALFSSTTPIALLSGIGVMKTAQQLSKIPSSIATLKAAEKLNRVLKASKPTQAAIKGLGTATQPVLRLAKYLTRTQASKTITAGAVGNTLEEGVIWAIERSKGYNTDLAAAATYGMFAPFMLSAAVSAIGTPVKVAARTIKAGARQAGIGKPTAAELDNPKAKPKQKIEELKEEIKKGDEADAIKSQKLINDTVDEVDDFRTYLEVLKESGDDEVNGILKAFKLFGEKELTDYFTAVAEGFVNNKIKFGIFDVFPFLRSVKDLEDHMKVVATANGVPSRERASFNWKPFIKEAFSVDPDHIGDYIQKFKLPENAPIKRGLDVEPNEIKELNNTKKDVQAIEQYRDNETLRPIVKVRDDMVKVVKDFLNCSKDPEGFVEKDKTNG